MDAGDGISKALLNQGINYNSITDIILSHYHSDHFAGLPSLLTQMIIDGRKDSLNIFTHYKLVESLKIFLKISYIFLEKLSFKINIKSFDFEENVSLCESIRFIARQNSHVGNKHNLNDDQISFISSSFLLLLNDSKIFYSSDIGAEDDLFNFDDYSPELMISEATHIPLSFFSELANKISPSKIYLTHIDDEQTLEDWYSYLPKRLKDKIIISYDGMTLDI